MIKPKSTKNKTVFKKIGLHTELLRNVAIIILNSQLVYKELIPSLSRHGLSFF